MALSKSLAEQFQKISKDLEKFKGASKNANLKPLMGWVGKNFSKNKSDLQLVKSRFKKLIK